LRILFVTITIYLNVLIPGTAFNSAIDEDPRSGVHQFAQLLAATLRYAFRANRALPAIVLVGRIVPSNAIA
jgi:hypothetical protein